MREYAVPGECAEVAALAFAPDGRTLFVCAGWRLAALDLSSGGMRWETETMCWQRRGPVSRLEIDPTGRFLAVSHRQGEATVYATHNGQCRAFAAREFNDIPPWSKVFATFGNGGSDFVAIAGRSRHSIAVENLGGDRRRRTVECASDECRGVARAGELLALASTNGRVSFWTPEGSAPRAAYFRYAVGDEAFVALTPDGGRLAYGLASRAVRSQLWLWDVTEGRVRGEIDVNGITLTDVAFSPDGRFLAGTCQSGGVFEWDAETRRLRVRYDWGLTMAFGVAFAPDGLTLAVIGRATDSSGRVVVWDVEG